MSSGQVLDCWVGGWGDDREVLDTYSFVATHVNFVIGTMNVTTSSWSIQKAYSYD